MTNITHQSAAAYIPLNARFLRLPDVMEITGLTKSTLLGCVKTGEFPRPIALSRRCVGWIRADVDKWGDSRIAASAGVTS